MSAAFLLFLWAMAPDQNASAATAGNCAYDRAAMLALSENEFDQNLQGGWRALEQKGCTAAAADLIRDYRLAHGLASKRPHILFWHEGQLRAALGQTEPAIRLFEQSRKTGEDEIGWNHYVDATIAFLRKDQAALLAARSALAELPRPADFRALDVHGKPVDIKWPPNLNVVDGFIACFGKSYDEAYGPACSKPIGQ